MSRKSSPTSIFIHTAISALERSAARCSSVAVAITSPCLLIPSSHDVTDSSIPNAFSLKKGGGQFGCSCFRELELVSLASRIFPTCTHARMTSAPRPLVIRAWVHVDGWPARLSSNMALLEYKPVQQQVTRRSLEKSKLIFFILLYSYLFVSIIINVQGNYTKSREFSKLCPGNKFLRLACMVSASGLRLRC